MASSIRVVRCRLLHGLTPAVCLIALLLALASGVVAQQPVRPGTAAQVAGESAAGNAAEAGPQRAGDASRAPQTEKIRDLVRRLESPSQSDRDAAERELIELGEEILNYLPAVTTGTAPEMKLRLERMQSQLEKQFAASIADGTVVNLSGRMKLSEALAALAEQTGNETLDYRDRFNQPIADPQVEVDLPGTSYFQGLDLLLDAAKLDVYNYAGVPRKLALVDRAPDRVSRLDHAAYDGLFRFEPVSVSAVRDLRQPKLSSMRLMLEIHWEPRVTPLTISHSLADLRMYDPDGAVMQLAGNATGTVDVPVQNTISGVVLELPLNLPDRSVPRIGKLTGRGTAVIPGMMTRFTFDGLAQVAGPVQQRQAGVTVTLESVQSTEDFQEFRMRLTLERGAPEMQSHLDWAMNNVAYLEDSQGRRSENPSLEKYLEKEHEVGYSYVFPTELELADSRLVYETPSMILVVPFEYELTDLELP